MNNENIESDENTKVTSGPTTSSRKDFLIKAGVGVVGAAGLAGLDGRTALAAPAFLRNQSQSATLQYWQLGGILPSQERYWQSVSAQYSKLRSNVKVDVTFVPNYTATNKLTASFAAGVGPDVFVISPGDLLRYVNNGIAQPLNTYMTAADIQDFLPSVLQAMEVHGKIYYLKYEMEPMALYYDKKLFAEKGLKPPTTWDEMVEAAIKLKTVRRAGIAIETIPDYYQNFTFYPFIWQGSGNVVDDAWTHAEIDGAAGAAALQLWGDLVHKYKVCPPKFIVRTSDITLLAKGFTAMQFCGIWAIAQLRQQFPSFEYGVVPLPHPATGHPQTVFGGWGVVANSQSKNPAEAARFATWLGAGTSTASAQRGAGWVAGVKTDLSPRKSVTAVQEEEGFFKPYPLNVFKNEIYPTALAEPRYTPEIVQAVSKAIQAVQFSGVSGASAAATAAREINAYLKTYKGAR